MWGFIINIASTVVGAILKRWIEPDPEKEALKKELENAKIAKDIRDGKPLDDDWMQFRD